MPYKNLIKYLGFIPKENTSGIYQKKYAGCNDYNIEVDVETEKINYGTLINAESSTTLNFTQNENWVVLECVNRLLEKGYQPQNIVLEKTWATGHGTSGRLDILVTRNDGSSYLMIECKVWGTEFDKEQKRIDKDGGQLFTYFQQDKNADVLMLYASVFDKC
ncbi:MAG: type I restriction enzyme HsdR N-terminal domain-containing protein, partial [Bacteroidetes bacterium]|nr:type I restriction enzyme HsdR N-terminal domain-containing protein [Bacteroidota bacterium]